MKTIEDVIIIGGGPAGIACAIQLKRYGIKAIIIEKENVGGLLLNANNLENYPGFPEGIKGTELVELMKEHVRQQEVEVLFEEVVGLDSKEELFKINTNRTSYFSKYVVISSGTKPKKFKDCVIPEELNEKVFSEVYPINSVKNKKIAIVGAGDAAFDYALNLEEHNDIVVLNRSKVSKCNPILFERVEESAKINYKKNMKIKSISSSSEGGIILNCLTPEGAANIEADYLLLAIGRIPCLDFLSRKLKGQVDENIENARMYLAGDVKNGILRQTAIAVGDGIKTAMKICNKIKGEQVK